MVALRECSYIRSRALLAVVDVAVHSGSRAKFKAEIGKAKYPWGRCEAT